MGPKFTDGSIIQHLAKMRARREADGKPVPPPLRRSVPAAASQAGSKKKKRRHGSDDDDNSDGSDDEDKSSSEEDSPETSQEELSRRRKAKKRKTSKSQSAKQAVKKEESESSSGEPDDDRLCVGYSFLKLRGKEEQKPDADRPNDDEPGPSAKDSKAKKKKVVRFNVPPAALRNLEETGSVYTGLKPEPSAEHTSLSHMMPSGMVPPGMVPPGRVFPTAQSMQGGQMYPATADWNALDNDILAGFPGAYVPQYDHQYAQQYGQQFGQQQSGGEMTGQTGFINPALLTPHLDFGGNWTFDPMLTSSVPPPQYAHHSPGGQQGGQQGGQGHGWIASPKLD